MGVFEFLKQVAQQACGLPATVNTGDRGKMVNAHSDFGFICLNRRRCQQNSGSKGGQ